MKILRLLCLLALVFGAIFGFAQNKEDQLGKTDAQILKMGRDKWFDFYSKKNGDSTAAMTTSAMVYADVLGRANERALKKTGSPRIAQIKRLRPVLVSFTNSVSGIGELTTGGTMWHVLSASAYSDAEQSIADLIANKRPYSKPAVVSEATRSFEQVVKQAATSARDNEIPDARLKEVNDEIASARKNLKLILDLAKGLNRHDSDRVLGFCRDHCRSTKSAMG